MKMIRSLMPAAILALAPMLSMAQEQPPASAASPTPTGNAAVVNGQPVTEAALQRALKRVPPDERDKARPEILKYLIDNTLLDQYLIQQGIKVDPKDVDTRLDQVKSELKKTNQDFEKLLATFSLTEAELKAQIEADLRWEQFVLGQTTEKALKEFYDANVESFDGSQVRARHILITPEVASPEQAKAGLAGLKKQLEDAADAEVAKQPATADALAKEQARAAKLESLFAEAARAHSKCPSSKNGGDLNWFPRAGAMVEPFAQAAFALKPYQLSEPVVTPFGAHLILVTGRRNGQAVKYDDIKDDVREIYAARVRDKMLDALRPAAKVEITGK